MARDTVDREELLVLAVYRHERQSADPLRANCWRVLRQAILWAGALDEKIDATLGQEDHPVMEGWYRMLISMSRRPDPLLWGEGNLGDESERPAFPAFTACGLTEKGRRVAKGLLEAHPHLAI